MTLGFDVKNKKKFEEAERLNVNRKMKKQIGGQRNS